MPLHIALCEDDSIQLGYLRRLIADWAKSRRESAEISEFSSAGAFLFTYEEDQRFDALILDIQLPGIDGLELARRIRRMDERIQILFVTGYEDYMAEGYEVSAVTYLVKPVDGDKLHSALDRAVVRLSRVEPTILVDTAGGTLRLAQRDILYVEAAAHGADIHVSGGVAHQSRAALAAIEEMLGPGDFIRCHRSYLVGIRHIRRILKSDVEIDGGALVPLSRRLQREVNRAFIAYYREGAQ